MEGTEAAIAEEILMYIPAQNEFVYASDEEVARILQQRLLKEQNIMSWILYIN